MKPCRLSSLHRSNAATLPKGQFHFYPDEGHLSLLVNRCTAVFDGFAQKEG